MQNNIIRGIEKCPVCKKGFGLGWVDMRSLPSGGYDCYRCGYMIRTMPFPFESIVEEIEAIKVEIENGFVEKTFLDGVIIYKSSQKMGSVMDENIKTTDILFEMGEKLKNEGLSSLNVSLVFSTIRAKLLFEKDTLLDINKLFDLSFNTRLKKKELLVANEIVKYVYSKPKFYVLMSLEFVRELFFRKSEDEEKNK